VPASFTLRSALLALLVVGNPACSMIVDAEFDVHRRDAGGDAGERPDADAAAADTGAARAGDVATGDAATTDAATGDGATGDAAAGDAPATRVCAATARFGAPVRLPLDGPDVVATWGSGGVWGARLSPDQLTVYFTAERGLWRATRIAVDFDFDMTSAIPLLTPSDPALDDWAPTVSGDGSALFYGSGCVDCDSNWQIFGASVVGQSLGPSAQVPSLSVANPAVQESMPYLLPDGKVIYFSSTRNGSWDIFRAERASVSGDFGAPEAVTSINTIAQEKVAVVSPDELAIYFSSDRADTNMGLSMIYVATRASRADDFGAALRLTELEVANDDNYPDWISADGCTMYLHHARPPAVFVATRAP